MLIVCFLLHIVIISFTTNQRFVYSNLLIDSLYPLWIYFVRSFLSVVIGNHVCLSAFIYNLLTIFISCGVYSVLPLVNVVLLDGLLVTTLSSCAEYLYFYFALKRGSRTHKHTRTPTRYYGFVCTSYPWPEQCSPDGFKRKTSIM